MNILLVDDEVLAIMALEQVLIDEGFQVTTAFNGQEALDRWRDDHFDAVMTDLKMPVMTGDQLAIHLRSERPDLPIIIASGYVTPDIAHQLKTVVGSPLTILPKPAHVEEIISALRRLLVERDTTAT